MTQRLLIAIGIACVSASTASAQSFANVPAGHRVRLMISDTLRQEPILPRRQLVVGHFVRATPDSVWFRPTGASEVSVARRVIKSAHVSLGASRARSAATFGFGLGLTTALVAYQSLEIGRVHRGQNALIGGSIGFGGGALIGALSPFEHWRRLRR